MEAYQKLRKEVLGQDWGASTSSAPHVKDRNLPERTNGKVRTLKKLLTSCVQIMKDETTLSTLYEMIYHYTQGRKTHVTQGLVNYVLRRKRTNEEYKFSVQIGEYDADNVILD